MAGISPAFWVVRTVLMLVGMEEAARSFTASIALAKTPSPRMASQVSGFAPSRPLGAQECAVGGDTGHDPLVVTGGEDLLEVGAEKRLAAAEIYLEDAGGVQLLNQVERFDRGEFAFGRLSR